LYQPTALHDAAVQGMHYQASPQQQLSRHYITGPRQTATSDVPWQRYALSQCF